MAQTTIQGSFLGDGTVTGVKIGADFISAQTALAAPDLVSTDEILVSDAGVIKRMDISVIEIAGTQITSGLVADARIAATLSRITATETLSSKSIDLGTNTLTGSVAEFNTALQSESFATLGGTETLVAKTLTTPTISSTGWTNALHAHAANNSGGTLSASILTGALPAISGANLTNLPAGGIASVAADTTPQVGGSAGFDLQTQLLVGNGGTTGIAVSSSGEVNMAAQPSFGVRASSGQSNVTGNSTVHPVEWEDTDSADWDIGSNFASDAFTAPVAGKYLMVVHLDMDGISTSGGHNNLDIRMRTVGGTYVSHAFDLYTFRYNTSFPAICILDLAANDVIKIEITASGSGGGDVLDVLTDSTRRTHWMGMLLG